MTQKELHDVVLVATRYAEVRREIQNALAVLNILKHMSYYGVIDPRPLKKKIYDLDDLLCEIFEFYEEDKIYKQFKDNTNE